jgi:hypothetical protein
MKRPGQPAELATTYVMLADPMSSYAPMERWFGNGSTWVMWPSSPMKKTLKHLRTDAARFAMFHNIRTTWPLASPGPRF